MARFHTAVFDLDGTLLNTLGDLTDSVNHVLAAHEYPLRKEEEIRRFVGNGSKLLILRSLPEGTDPQRAEDLHNEYLEWYSAHNQIRTAPYEGIVSLLTELKQRGVAMAVVSNKGDRQVKPLTRQYFPQIDYAVGERPSIAKKPAPDSILEAMKALGADPETTLYVGDSEVDIETARNAGITAVSVTWGFRDEDELAARFPDFIFRTPEELLPLF